MNPFWVETGTAIRLAIVPRPRGNDWLEDEVTQMKRAGVDVLVSMLQPDEAAELGLSEEAALCAAGGIQFRSFPIPDRETPPSTAAFAKFVEELRVEAHAGRSVRCPLQGFNRALIFTLSGLVDCRRAYTR